MATWQYRLDIKDIWQQAEDGELEPYQLAQAIAQKMRDLNCPDGDFQDLVEEFASTHPDATFDDTDIIMEALYDWGDIALLPRHKMCWIATF